MIHSRPVMLIWILVNSWKDAIQSHSTSMCFDQYQASSAENCDVAIFTAYCQVTEWFSADVNDSQFCFSQVLKDCLGDVKGSLFVASGDNRTTHCAIDL